MATNGYVCNILDKLFRKIVYTGVNYFVYADLFKTINIYEIEKNFVYTDPAKTEKLFCVSLENKDPYINERKTVNYHPPKEVVAS